MDDPNQSTAPLSEVSQLQSNNPETVREQLTAMPPTEMPPVTAADIVRVEALSEIPTEALPLDSKPSEVIAPAHIEAAAQSITAQDVIAATEAQAAPSDPIMAAIRSLNLRVLELEAQIANHAPILERAFAFLESLGGKA